MNEKRYYEPQFEAQLIRALEGYTPTNANAQMYANKAMSAKPASDKQKAYLKTLGYAGEREGLSMAEASKLIEKLKGGY